MTTSRRGPVAVAMAVLVLAVAGCSDDDGDTAGSGSSDTTVPTADDGNEGDGGEAAAITIEEFDFGDPVTVAAGEEVVVTNLDAVAHTWTADDESFDSGAIDSGAEFRHTFDAAGTYEFFCRFHPSMTGSITVTDA